MRPQASRLAALALLIATSATLPAWAASSTASSASESVSTSVGSVSTSFRKSSDSSSKDDKVAQGDYRVEEVAAVDERPGLVRLKLQALAQAGEDGVLYLYLPPAAAAQGGVAPGAVVTANPRPYGVEFARADNRAAFFLVLADEWYRELASNPVTL
mgnify:CR=1 FL=1